MAKKRGLAANRGLDALLGSIKKEKQIAASTHIDNTQQQIIQQVDGRQGKNSDNVDAANVSEASEQNDENISLIQIDVQRLQRGRYQPRRDMSETALAELAQSISQHGVMQPIVIRPLLVNEAPSKVGVTHEIIAGERRWRAAIMAGHATIPAIERALSDELAIALALIENIQREDLSVIEQAEALQRFNTEFGMSHAMIADVVGKARTTVSNLLRLNQLHEDVKDHLAKNHLDMGHARALLSLSAGQQPIIAKKIIDQQMTVRAAEKLVKSILNPESAKSAKLAAVERDIQRLNQQLSDRLGATVKLKQKKGGKGSVEIFFHSEDELNALLDHLKTP